MEKQQIPKLTFFEKFGFGLGDMACNFIWGTLGSFLTFFYTNIYGIDISYVGWLLLFSRCTDGLIDFCMGAIADRTNTRWGKFRPYLLWMCIPFAVVFTLTFTTPDLGNFGKVVYAWVTYNLLMFVYTAINIPYGAISGVMTDDPLDRTSLNSYRMGLARIGSLLISAMLIPLTAYFGGLRPDFNDGKTPLTDAEHIQASHGYMISILVFAGVSIVLFLLTFFATKERIRPDLSQKTKLSDDLKILWNNPHWLTVLIAAMIAMTFISVRESSVFFYATYYAHLGGMTTTLFGLLPKEHPEDFASLLLLLTNVGFILGATSTRIWVRFLGKKYSYMATFFGLSVTCASIYFIPPDQTTLIFTASILNGYFGGVNAAVFFTLIGDTADFSEWKFKVRTTGIIFAAITCCQKVGWGLGGFVAAEMLSVFGYNEKHVTPEAINGILLIVSLVPAVGYLLIVFLFNIYGLTEDFLAKIREELAIRRGANQT